MSKEEKNNVIYLRDIGDTELKAIDLCKDEHKISVTTKAVKQIFTDYLALKAQNSYFKKEIEKLKEKEKESERKLTVLKSFKNMLNQLE